MKVVAEQVGAFSRDQLILGPCGVGDAVVGLDELAWQRAGIAANGVPRRWREHAGMGGQSRQLATRVQAMAAVVRRLAGVYSQHGCVLVTHGPARADTGMPGRVGRMCICRSRECGEGGLASHLDVACVGCLVGA